MSAPVAAAAVEKVQELAEKVKKVVIKDTKPRGEKKVKKAKNNDSGEGPLEVRIQVHATHSELCTKISV